MTKRSQIPENISIPQLRPALDGRVIAPVERGLRGGA